MEFWKTLIEGAKTQSTLQNQEEETLLTWHLEM
jgi:hypothetical protein